MRPNFRPSSKGLSSYSPVGKSLSLRAPLNGYTGYGLHATYVARSFFGFGYRVHVLPLHADKDCFEDVKDFVVDQRKEGRVLLLAPPATKVEDGTWFYTMHETTQLGPEALENVCRAEAIIVPSRWCQQCFNAQGVALPVHVVPIGINLGFFHPAKRKPSLCTFGSAGNLLLSGPNRKNMGMLILAFMEAFRTEKDVRLSLKVRPECPVPDVQDSRILVIRQQFSQLELSDWFRSLTAYVSPSRCEAFGQMNLQAMACAVPVVSCAFGGVLDYHDERHGYAIDYKLVPASDQYYQTGLWADPDMDSLILQLRRVYEDRREAEEKGLLARKVAEAYNWNTVNLKLESVLKREGFWSLERKTPVPQSKPGPPPVASFVPNEVKEKSLWSNELKNEMPVRLPLWLARRTGGHEPVFYMSGDFGDLIYALPTIRALGGGQLCVGPARDNSYYWLREPMTEKRYAVIEPLLQLQRQYLSRVFWSDEMAGWKCHVDLNDSRRLHREPYI